METTTSPSPRKRQKRVSPMNDVRYMIMVTYKDPLFPNIMSGWSDMVGNAYREIKQQELSMLRHEENRESMRMKKFTCDMMINNRIVCSVQSEYLDHTQLEGREKFKQWTQECKSTTRIAWDQMFL